MKIAMGSDHAGFALKEALKEYLCTLHDINDFGTTSESSVDYPVFAEAVGRSVAEGEAERGILICGSGIGMAIAANKVKGIRASVVHDVYSARVAVEHNNLNVLAMGGRVIGVELAREIALAFLSARFVGGRHERRIAQIAELEKTLASFT